jgi:D-alanyl-D-alanine carboxypeptidase
VWTEARPALRRVRWPHRGVFWLLAVSVAGAGIAVGVDRAVFSQPTQAARPDLQRVLDGLVAGPSRIAPGATAYVSGSHGSWLGAAGVADTGTGAQMPVDARMRLESVSKIYTATLILQLAQDGDLRVSDTVARWLPGLLPYGNRITIRQLLTMQSGLIDNNDLVNASASAQRANLARVKDAELRAQLLAIAARVNESPAGEFSPIWWIKFAAWQPLLFTPGTGYHYSNIGYDILGLIAARAAAKPLSVLYRERIFQPLDLQATAYDPQGPIGGPHARGYGIEPNGKQFEATNWHYGIGAEGGIVSDAKDTADFLTALMHGKLLERPQLTAMEGDNLWLGGAPSGCAGHAYGWSGGGNGYKTEVWVNDGGSRVAVLLLNARHRDTAQPAGDQAAHDALTSLYCGA